VRQYEGREKEMKVEHLLGEGWKSKIIKSISKDPEVEITDKAIEMFMKKHPELSKEEVKQALQQYVKTSSDVLKKVDEGKADYFRNLVNYFMKKYGKDAETAEKMANAKLYKDANPQLYKKKDPNIASGELYKQDLKNMSDEDFKAYYGWSKDAKDSDFDPEADIDFMKDFELWKRLKEKPLGKK
jgi:hypothetical protein